MKEVRLFFIGDDSDPQVLRDSRSLGNFIGTLNKICKGWDIVFRLHTTVDEDIAFEEAQQALTFSQDPEQELFVFVWASTVEETVCTALEALLQQLNGGQPRSILTFFRAGCGDEKIQKLKEKLLTKWLHYVTEYEHIDSLKLRLITSLHCIGLSYLPLTCRDGEIVLGGDALMSTENLPMFTKNPTLCALLAEKTELEPRYLDLKEKYCQNNKAYYDEYSPVATRYNALLKAITKEEEALYRFSESLTEKLNTRQITPAIAAAQRFLEQGDLVSADLMLDKGQIKACILTARRQLRESKRELAFAVDELLFKADILRRMEPSEERIAEIRVVYEEAVEIAEEAHVRLGALHDFAGWLYGQNDHQHAIKLMERLLTYDAAEPVGEAERAKYLNLLGILYGDYKLSKNAEKLHQESLEILRKLSSRNPVAHQPHLAMCLSNVGNSCENNGHMMEADKFYRESLELFRELASKNPAAYQPGLSSLLNNFGAFCADNGRPEEAERFYCEALEICRELASKNPTVYQPDLSSLLNNYGALHAGNGRMKEADKFYRESLELFRELASKNPAAYQPGLSSLLNNFGVFCADNDRPEEAERFYCEALEICRELASKNPTVYQPDLASSLENYSVYCENNGRPEEADKTYCEVLETYQELASQNPAAHQLDLARVLNHYGIFCFVSGRLEEADKLFREVVELWRELESKDSLVYRLDLAEALYNYGIFCKRTNRFWDAIKLFREAIGIREKSKERPTNSSILQLFWQSLKKRMRS